MYYWLITQLIYSTEIPITTIASNDIVTNEIPITTISSNNIVTNERSSNDIVTNEISSNNKNTIQDSLFKSVKSIIGKNLINDNFKLINANKTSIYNEIIIEKDILTLIKSTTESDYKTTKTLNIIKYIDDNKQIKTSLITDINSFFKIENLPNDKLIRICNKVRIPKVYNLLVDYYSLNTYYTTVLGEKYDVSYIADKYAWENYFKSFTNHEDISFSITKPKKNSFFSFELFINQVNLKLLLKNYLLKVSIAKFVDQDNLIFDLKFHDKIIDFICGLKEFDLAMIFYERKSVLIDINCVLDKEFLELDNQDNLFLKKVRLDTNFNSKYKKFMKFFINTYNLIRPSEYKNAFYLFNGTRNTDIYDLVLRKIFETKNLPEKYIMTSLFNAMGYIKDTDMKKILKSKKNKKQELDIYEIIKESRRDINNFIETDVYKAFVILYYIKINELQDEIEEFHILKDKELLDYMQEFTIVTTLREITEISKRPDDVNSLFSTNLSILIKHCTSYTFPLQEAKVNILKKILILMRIVIGDEVSIEEEPFPYMSSLDIEEAEDAYDVGDVLDCMDAILEVSNKE